MKFLNVGILELLFILLLALIVLGPRKAIQAAGEVGRWIKQIVSSDFWREIVTTSREIKELPKKLMDEAELQKTIEELDRSTAEVNAALKENSIGGDYRRAEGDEKIQISQDPER